MLFFGREGGGAGFESDGDVKGGWSGRSLADEKGAGSVAQGFVLLGALLVCHDGDEGLHGSAQIVRHVKQTADGGTPHGCPLLPPWL